MLPGLSELAGGLPIAASFAMASGITVLREGRRRTSLNEAMHELRRPLQGLVLSLAADRAGSARVESCIRMAVAAAEALDREINGGATAAPVARLPVRPLVESAVERWRPHAAAAGRSLSLCWRATEPALPVAQVELAQALDNLISNALVHGDGAVVLDAAEVDDRLSVAVRDAGRVDRRRPGRRVPVGDRVAGRNRHGHGLRIVRRVAARHGGNFHLRRSPCGTEARLELPLTGADR